MSDPKLPAAKRRLNTLLKDPEYGARLARLNRKDEREVLDLIYENKGREARARLLQLDQERRTLRTIKDRVRTYRRKSIAERKIERPDDESRLFWELYDDGAVA